MFLGNASLRRKGEKIDYSQEMIDELIKCKTDIVYFAEKYFYIVTGKKGKSKIVLYEWQKKVLKAFVETPNNKRHCIVKIARQSGKCFLDDTKVKIRNKKTGEVKEITVGEFYNKIKKS